MGITYKESQGQTERAVALQDDDDYYTDILQRNAYCFTNLCDKSFSFWSD